MSGDLPLVIVGARARAWRGMGTVADGAGWELWAAEDARSARRVALEHDGARVEQEAGHRVHRWETAEGQVAVRVWGAGTSGYLFVQANADAPTETSPAGPACVARSMTLRLIARASLTEPADWLSRMCDYHGQRVSDADASPLERAAFELRCAEIAAHAKPVHRVSMRAPNSAFFGSFKYDIRLFEHDDLHRATCYYDVPLYLKLKDDPELAYIPRRNFESLDHRDRVRLVREECYAIALERVVIPAEALGMRPLPEDAYLYALHRVCTDLATGWFRDFAIEAFADVQKFDVDYVGRFKAAVKAGRARPRHDGPVPARVRRVLIDHLRRVDDRQRLAGLPGAMPRPDRQEPAASRLSDGPESVVCAG